MKNSMKIKVEIIRFHNLIGMRVLEFPEKLRGDGVIYIAKNGWSLQSRLFARIILHDKAIHLFGTDISRDQLAGCLDCRHSDPKIVMREVEEAIHEFNEFQKTKSTNTEFDGPRVIE